MQGAPACHFPGGALMRMPVPGMLYYRLRDIR
jgi:hypothetical protein